MYVWWCFTGDGVCEKGDSFQKEMPGFDSSSVFPLVFVGLREGGCDGVCSATKNQTSSR